MSSRISPSHRHPQAGPRPRHFIQEVSRTAGRVRAGPQIVMSAAWTRRLRAVFDGSGGFLTVAQVAAFLSVKPQRIREQIKYRRLRAVKVGRQLRISKRALEEFIERNSTHRRDEP